MDIRKWLDDGVLTNLCPRIDPRISRVDYRHAIFHQLLLNPLLHDLAGSAELASAIDSHRILRPNRSYRNHLAT